MHFYFMYVCVHTCAWCTRIKTTVHVWRSDISYGNSFSPSTVCIPGLELGTSGLATSAVWTLCAVSTSHQAVLFYSLFKNIVIKFFCSNPVISSETEFFLWHTISCLQTPDEVIKKEYVVAFTERKIKCKVKLS